jgi:predicted RNA-binding protein with PUA-like domain
MSKNYWLMKSEPDCFGIKDLQAKPKQTDMWDGVRNYQARNMMRDEMKKGDQVFFYHSNTKPPHIAGLCEIASAAYPDPTQFDPDSQYYDPKSSKDEPRWWLVDVKFIEEFPEKLSLQALKDNPKLKDMKLVQKGSRLSVQPVTPEEWQEVMKMMSKAVA